MAEALQYDFMRNALLAGLLVSVACGIIGTYVVIKRIVFISGGIAHAAYGGIGMAYYFGWSPVLGAIIFSLASAFGMGLVQRKTKERADSIIGVMWAIGMAIGIIFLDLTPGYKADLMSYLFGSILAVPIADLWVMLIMDLVIVLLVILFFKELLGITFDEQYATILNVPVRWIYLLLMAMIGFSVVMLMRVVGLIMVIALLTIPASIGAMFLHEIKKIMIVASLLGMVFTTIGLFSSYFLNLTSGATIILIAGIAYIFSLFFQYLRTRTRRIV
ncbi:MAG: metal ABC transporter permease [Anaerolineaceae bacterium]